MIGSDSQIETGNGGGGNVGIGFAVPSNTVKSVVAQLLDDGRVDRAYLGVSLQDIESDVADVLSSRPTAASSSAPSSRAARRTRQGSRVAIRGSSSPARATISAAT